jgi:hypothetical protein
MAVVKVVRELECQDRRARGENPHLVIKHAGINERENILFAGEGKNEDKLLII